MAVIQDFASSISEPKVSEKVVVSVVLDVNSLGICFSFRIKPNLSEQATDMINTVVWV